MSVRPTAPATRPARANDQAPGSAKELKRSRREQQLAQRERFERAEQRRRRLVWGGVAIPAVVVLGALGWWLFGPTDGPKVQSLPVQGQTHIQEGQSHPPYNSVPPTSGWHYGNQVAPPGVSRAPIADEIQVHNLEHGEIMVQYDCPQGCDEMISKLETIVRGYPKKVVLAPYPGLVEKTQHKLALTAWGKLVYLDAADEPYIRRFIAQNKDKAPEFFPD
ncbi:MAG TPA: DUF3105 domain-containing protein [Chloroflexota bacterium]|nr:DUF3105 domain-containing protein [Chloroflexota bacterium]